MNHLKFIIILLAFTPGGSIGNCQLKFNTDSETVDLRYFDMVPETPELLVCGIREHKSSHSDYWSISRDEEIDWNAARCLDEHIVVVNISEKATHNPSEQQQDYLIIRCISQSPIETFYDGNLPSPVQGMSTYFHSDVGRFVTNLRVEYSSAKSGNYSFVLADTETPEGQWFYILFKSDAVSFWRPQQGEGNLQDVTYEDPNDASKIIIPCQLTDPGAHHVSLAYPNFSQESASNGSKSLKLITSEFGNVFDPRKGFVADKAEFSAYMNWTSLMETDGELSIYCVKLDIPYVAVKVYVSFDRKNQQEMFKLSSTLKLEFQLGSATCLLNEVEKTTVSVSNIEISTLSEWRFVSGFSLMREENKNTTYTEISRRKFVLCHNSLQCQLSSQFHSGMIRCSALNQEDYATELYFTGLDNQPYTFREWKTLHWSKMMNVSASKVSSLRDCGNQRIFTRAATCQIVYFVAIPGFLWTLVYQNGTEEVLPPDFMEFDLEEGMDSSRWTYSENITFEFTSDVHEIKCKTFVRDSKNEFIEGRHDIILNSKPKILNRRSTELVISQNQTVVTLTCMVHGRPKPKIKWVFKEQEIKYGIQIFEEYNQTQRSVLTLTRSVMNFTGGYYICEAINSNGKDTTSFLVTVHDDIEIEKKHLRWPAYIWAVGVAGFLLTISATVAAIILYLKLKRNAVLTSDYALRYLNGDPEITHYSGDTSNLLRYCYDVDKELGKEEFCIDHTGVLGTGYYGIVKRAKVCGANVAVKILKTNTSKKVLRDFLSEIKITSSLGEHPNIISYIGAHTTSISKGELYLILELCELGSLDNYFRTQRKLRLESDEQSQLNETDLVKRLMTWGIQTASGMKFLSDRNVIHRDLATRNLLLKDINSLKITDFGLAKQLTKCSVYKTRKNKSLPWRHMAPESLSAMEFSLHSDVWAFGVTLWEIFSIGEIPYCDMQQNRKFISNLKQGLRLPKTILCPQEAFAVMLSCWELSPKSRPDFSSILAILQTAFLTSYDSDYMNLCG